MNRPEPDQFSPNHFKSGRISYTCMARKWTKSYMRTRFPAEVREKRLEQGLDPTEKPTHVWLRQNGYRQFLRRVRELGYTPDDFLLSECGFEPRTKEWPCTNAEVISEVEDWLEYHDTVGERLNDGSIKNARTHLRRIMEISKECIGTTNLLKYGRGDQRVCVERGKRLMEKLKEEFSNSGTRLNYVTTFRDFLRDKHHDGVVEHDPMTSLVARSEWTYEPEQPECVPTPRTVKRCFESCETLVEQMIILSLAGHGKRPSSLTGDEDQDAYTCDAPIPHRDFSAGRKNGPGVVPLVIGVDLVKEYFDRLNADPEYNGEILPSVDAEDGARSDTWVRNKVKEIADRANVTLPNGEDLNPKDFRQFWYTHFVEGYSEWIDKNDDVGALRGVSSGKSVMTYTLEGTSLEHFLDYMEPILEVAFPDHIEPADELGNVDVEPDRMASGQQALEEFVADIESNNEPLKSPIAVVIDGYFAVCDQIGNRVSQLWRECADVDVWASVEQTRMRTAAFAFCFGVVMITALSLAMVEVGAYSDSIAVSQKGIALVFGVFYGTVNEGANAERGRSDILSS